MQLVIHTQFMENYAAHNEDFEPGVSEDYWKYKGGETYTVELGESYSAQDCATIISQLEPLIEYSYASAKEYIIDWEVAGSTETPWESWETPWQLTVVEQQWTASRYVPADDYWKAGVLGKNESFIMGEYGKREQYSHSYVYEKSVA